MRFNDQLQTILAAPGDGQSGAVSLWRQCVDLLAQHDRAGGADSDGPGMDPGARDALLARLRQIAPRVGESQRMASAVELGSRLRSPALVQLFAADRPAICAAALTRARLPDAAWPSLLSRLGPTARGVLRHRRDLGPETMRALEAFGSVDFQLSTDIAPDEYLLTPQDVSPVLYAPVEEPAPAVPLDDDRSIQKLVERIERFTEARREHPLPIGDPPGDPQEYARTLAARFAFETNADGVMTWVDQGPRGALIGLSIAESALDGTSGPDGYALGAFRRRGGFRNARYTIAAGTGMAGDWRISATPVFDTRSGRFQGYRGEARRPWPHEVPGQSSGQAAGEASDPLGAHMAPDSLRQLVHELRTPLNAILGFAEIIEKQLFGPASTAYRGLAGDIVVDARRLLGAFDDLDTASRMARGDLGGVPRAIDIGVMVASVAARFDGGAPIRLAMPAQMAPVAMDPVQAERMVQHLMRTLVSVAGPGETLNGACRQTDEGRGARIILAIDRPAALRGLEEPALLDPGYGPDGEWPDAPLLGVGFSLRLVRSLAVSAGGRLEIDSGHIALSLPAMVDAAVEDKERL